MRWYKASELPSRFEGDYGWFYYENTHEMVRKEIPVWYSRNEKHCEGVWIMPLAVPQRPPSSDEDTHIGERYRHVRSGHLYEILYTGLNERTLTPVVIYRRVNTVDSTVWVRDYAEFFDGRFEAADE